MMWNNDWSAWGGTGWCLMIITTAVVIGGIVWAIAAVARNDGTPPIGEEPNAEELLARRLARGEITEDQYTRQRDLITEHR